MRNVLFIFCFCYHIYTVSQYNDNFEIECILIVIRYSKYECKVVMRLNRKWFRYTINMYRNCKKKVLHELLTQLFFKNIMNVMSHSSSLVVLHVKVKPWYSNRIKWTLAAKFRLKTNRTIYYFCNNTRAFISLWNRETG